MKFGRPELLNLAELEARSVDIDIIGEDQLENLLQPRTEIPLESSEPIQPIEEPEPEPPVVAPEESKEQQPEVNEPVEAETEEEQPVIEQEASEEPVPIEQQTTIPEEDLFEPPQQLPVESDGVVEIETIESAIPVERISREQVNRQFNSLVKGLKVDLDRRSQSVAKRDQQRRKEQNSATRVRKVKTIVSDNRELFRQKQIAAKWKSFPLSRLMQKEYLPKVNDVVRTYWNLPLEMDSDLEIRVKVVVAKTGEILDYEIVESSSNRFFNHAVVQVFKNLDQLPPLPEGFSGESTEIGLRFTSKQFNTE